MDWTTTSAPGQTDAPTLGFQSSFAEPQTARELEHFLKLETPSVLECFDEVEHANKAIAETTAQEQASTPPAPRPCPTSAVAEPSTNAPPER